MANLSEQNSNKFDFLKPIINNKSEIFDKAWILTQIKGVKFNIILYMIIFFIILQMLSFLKQFFRIMSYKATYGFLFSCINFFTMIIINLYISKLIYSSIKILNDQDIKSIKSYYSFNFKNKLSIKFIIILTTLTLIQMLVCFLFNPFGNDIDSYIYDIGISPTFAGFLSFIFTIIITLFNFLLSTIIFFTIINIIERNIINLKESFEVFILISKRILNNFIFYIVLSFFCILIISTSFILLLIPLYWTIPYTINLWACAYKDENFDDLKN